MKKLSESLKYVIKISKLIKVKQKKRKIIFSVLLSNTVVFLDLLIIFYFTSFFQNIKFPTLLFIDQVLENRQLLPIIILFRFFIIYLDVMNVQRLRFSIEENLRIEAVNDVFIRGNLSTSDSYFYLNTLCTHISQFYQNLVMLLSALTKVIAFTFYLSFSHPEIFQYLVMAFPILYFPSKLLTKYNRKFSHISYEYSEAISRDLEKVIDNLFLIKILNKFNDEIRLFKNNLSNYYSAQINNQKSGLLNSLFPTLVTMLFLSFALMFEVTIKFLTLDIIAIFLRLFQSIGEVNKYVSMTVSTYIHLENLEKFEQNRLVDFSSNYKVAAQKDTINAVELLDVSFQYVNSEKFIFSDLSLKIPRNKHIKVTGPNGSGKSTLLGLISGVYYPQKGQVKTYVSKFAYVSAYPMIINSSLRENLIYGRQEAILDEKKALDLISKFKLFQKIDIEVLDLRVSNKTLSSGQMQKVSFIRALLSEPEILILDEATSNLDEKTKILIDEVLNNLNLTIINSTHSSDENNEYSMELKVKSFGEYSKVYVEYKEDI